MKSEVVKKRARKLYYIKGVNINYSFDSLEAIIERLGGQPVEGDVIIADNKHGDKRKAFTKTINGRAILYACSEERNLFMPLLDAVSAVNGGLVRGNKEPLIDFLDMRDKA